MTYFPGAVGVRDSCRLCDSVAEETQKRSFFSRASIHYTARTFLSVRFSESLQGFADARCVFLPPPTPLPLVLPPSFPSPLVPAWAQALNQSIGAPGTGEHSSVSVLPREAQPCLGRCICSPPGQEGEPRCPPRELVALEGLLAAFIPPRSTFSMF